MSSLCPQVEEQLEGETEAFGSAAAVQKISDVLRKAKLRDVAVEVQKPKKQRSFPFADELEKAPAKGFPILRDSLVGIYEEIEKKIGEGRRALRSAYAEASPLYQL